MRMKKSILFTVRKKWKKETNVLQLEFSTGRKRWSYYTVSIKSSRKQKTTNFDFVWKVHIKELRALKDLIEISKILSLPKAHVIKKQ